MTSSLPPKALKGVQALKSQLSDRIALFIDEPEVLAELSQLRHVRRATWSPDTDYYGNRKHHSQYRAERAAKEAGEKVPRWNSVADTSSYPLASRIAIERQTHGNHGMHKQLRCSIAAVLTFLVRKCDLASGVCLSINMRGQAREVYVIEIAKATHLGKRTVQRALSTLARHRLINRGVALIGLTPALYKALGFYSAIRALISSLAALQQIKGYRGRVIDPGRIIYHKNFHRFRTASAYRPSVAKLLTSLAIPGAKRSTLDGDPKVPLWNSTSASENRPPSRGPPPEAAPHHVFHDKDIGRATLASLKSNHRKLP